jgi:hypothetical protein
MLASGQSQIPWIFKVCILKYLLPPNQLPAPEITSSKLPLRSVDEGSRRVQPKSRRLSLAVHLLVVPLISFMEDMVTIQIQWTKKMYISSSKAPSSVLTKEEQHIQKSRAQSVNYPTLLKTDAKFHDRKKSFMLLSSYRWTLWFTVFFKTAMDAVLYLRLGFGFGSVVR